MLRLISLSSCPASMRKRTISTKPFELARWRLVLDLSSKSGFSSRLGELRMMRLTSVTSLSSIARRRRVEASILAEYQHTVVIVGRHKLNAHMAVYQPV